MPAVFRRQMIDFFDGIFIFPLWVVVIDDHLEIGGCGVFIVRIFQHVPISLRVPHCDDGAFAYHAQNVDRFDKGMFAPELGTLNRKKIATFVGVAPLNCDSGRYRGKRRIKGGRANVRRKLYMAAVASIRHNPAIKDFYDKLIDAGKPPKLALTACMRKILTILNAMMKNRTYWIATC
jgi:transposase